MFKISRSRKIHHLLYVLIRTLPVLALMLAASHLVYRVGGALANPAITATKTDALVVDNNSNSQADPGDTLEYTVVVQNSGSTDATGAVFNDTIDSNTTLIGGSLRTTPIARNDSGYSTVGNVQLSVPVGQSVLNNDNDPDGTGAVTLTGVVGCADVTAPFDCPGGSANGGDVTLNADGSFTFNPAPGFAGADTFTYTVQDVDGNTDPATVSIAVGQVVWFINNAVAGPGDGRFTSPFNSVANFNSLAADDPGDYIFVYQGSGAYSGAFALLNNQQLIGHGVGLTIAPNLSIAAASRPTIANVALGSGNTVRGLNINTSSGTGISGASVGSLTINNASVNSSNGTAVNLSNGTLAVTFDSVSSSNSTTGISLSSTTGSFVVSGGMASGSGGVLQNMSVVGVLLNNSSGALSNFTLNKVDISNVTQDGVRLSLLNTAQGTFTIDGLRLLGPSGEDGVDLVVEDNATGNITVKNGTFQNSGFGFGGVILQANDNATGAWQVLNNTFFNNGGSAIIAASFVNSTPTVVVANNNIDCPGGTAGGCQAGDGVRIVQDGNGMLQAFVDNNVISRSAFGIEARARFGTDGTGRMDIRIRDNSVSNLVGPLFLEGITIEAGTSSGTHLNTLCLNILTGNTPPAGNNSSVGSGGATDGIRISERTGATFLVQGASNGSSDSTIDTLVTGSNTGGVSVRPGTYDGGTCTTPVQTAQLQNDSVVQTTDTTPANVVNLAALKSKVSEQALRLVNDLVSAASVQPAYTSGETVMVTLGVLNPGQQVTITFRVIIDDPLASPASQVCNQGTLSGSNFSNVLTDDPDIGGSTDPTCTFLADNVPPDTSITNAPSDPSNDSSPTFEFTGTDNITPAASLTFECDLDSGGFTSCTSPHTYPSVADGSHTFQVRAIDLANNVDQSPASFTWTIDATPPSVTINQASGQADPTSDSPINFTVVFNEPVTGFGDSAGDVSLVGSTAGPTTVVVTEIAPNDGTTYDVTVSGMTTDGTVIASIPANAATDAVGNGNTASTSTDNTVTFIFDNVPPDTFIDTFPANPTIDTSATFTFHGTDNITPAGDLTFECQLDGGGFASCTSPKSYSGLSLGSHTFEVRAKDAAGNVDLTPASYTWDIHAATSLLYNGDQVVNVGNTFKAAAQLSSSASACVSGKTISFSLDVDPTGGSSVPFPLGSAVTNSSGQATLSGISTGGWQEGIYMIRADFAGTSECDPSFDEATLTAASPGNSATGGGWYTLSGSGRVSFGFNVRKVDNKCQNNCDYKGNLLLMNNGKWKLKGTLDAYVKLATGEGAASGVGDLYWWDASLNDGLGDWVLAESGVSFTINFFDSGGKGKKSTDAFGINIQYTPISPPQPNNLPNSDPVQLKGGDIKVK